MTLFRHLVVSLFCCFVVCRFDFRYFVVSLFWELIGASSNREFPGFFFEVLHHGVEGGTSVTGGDSNSVHVNFHGEHATLEATDYLVADVEDEGGVYTVVEQHLQVHVVAVLVPDILVAPDVVAGMLTDSEGEQSSAGNIDVFAILVTSALPAGAVVDGDGVVAASSAVQY